MLVGDVSGWWEASLRAVWCPGEVAEGVGGVVIVRWVTGFLDSPSREAEPFWEAVTGWSLSSRRAGGRFATLVPGRGDACLRVQVVGEGPARAHLDLHVDDIGAAAERVMGLGADAVADLGDVLVLRSPAGIVFCLVSWQGERVRPAGGDSVVDQLCLDVPAAVYEPEVEFWSAVTGWPVRATDLPEFSYLQRPAGMGLRLLLQRVGGAAAGVHVDFACTDVDAEVARHVGCGAEVVRRVPGDWTTLRDPLGREYCVTGRRPLST
ncbi:VOC family protein [Actinoplanes xinjiangensis]|uniref:VOC family protein n=1 Tax=Actinoplanes xinjiangensis TaxID=512350 RepID=UPI001EF34882|nr:VOC family protein [Actinoplanes xinjiangensis]